MSDCYWALNKARRYIFAGGDPDHPDYVRYVDIWLDYMNTTCGGFDFAMKGPGDTLNG